MNLIQVIIVSITVGKNPLEVALTVNQRVWNAVLGCSLKNDRMISVHFQGTLFSITVIQAYAQPQMPRSWSWPVLWRPTRSSRSNSKNKCPFHHRGLECKSRKSKEPGVTGNFGLGVWNEAGQRLTEFCQENALVIANILFQQHKRWLYTWTSPDGQYWNQIDYILCSQRWRSSIQSAKTRPGVDCGSDHELLVAKFRLKLKKVGKTTRPFRYDFNLLRLYSGSGK